MQGIHNFIIEPIKNRYDNEKTTKSGNRLILNTSLDDHRFVSREARVIATPVSMDTEVKVGDKVIVHHNIFRRFYNMRNELKNSSSYISEDRYYCHYDQIYMKDSGNGWEGVGDYCFVSPVENDERFSLEKEKPNVGILQVLNKRMSSKLLKKLDIIGFTPNSEYEFIVDGKRMFRMREKDICIKYGDAMDVKEYQPNWAN